MRSSSCFCSSTVSSSFRVETLCFASTNLQQVPASERASDDSAAGVQVLDDIHESWNGLDQSKRLGIEHGVPVLEPRARHRIVAADNGIERTVEAHEQDRELERLLSALERVIAAAHAGNGCLRYTDHGREQLVGQAELGRGPERRLGEDGGLVDRGCRDTTEEKYGALHFCRNNIAI